MNKLDALSELQAKRDLLKLQKNERYRALIEPIAQGIADLEMEFALPETEVDAEIEALTAEIKANVLAHGESVKGQASGLMAVFSRGRVSWDHKRLEGYAAAYPELLAFRTVGEPSVSIRTVGK